jgi:hypothetical protein
MKLVAALLLIVSFVLVCVGVTLIAQSNMGLSFFALAIWLALVARFFQAQALSQDAENAAALRRPRPRGELPWVREAAPASEADTSNP